MDFAKAFDNVSHIRLARKVQVNEIKGKILELLKQWLKQRKLRVMQNGNESEWRNVVRRVP